METRGETASSNRSSRGPLPAAVLRKVLACLTRRQLLRMRLVSQSFNAAATAELNGAFFDVEQLLKRRFDEAARALQKQGASGPLFLRYRSLRAALCEYRVLFVVYGRLLASGRACFTAVPLLDLLYHIASPHAALRDDDAATLHLLCGAFLDYADQDARRRHRLLGVEIVDLLDCLAGCNYRLFVTSKGRARRLAGSYEAVGELSVGAFPELDTKKAGCGGGDGEELSPEGVAQLVRFLRNVIRWNNFLRCVDEPVSPQATETGPGGSPPRSRSPAAQKTFARHVGEPGKDTGLVATLNLVCDHRVAPLRIAQQRRAGAESVPKADDALPMVKYEFSLDLSVRCGPSDRHKVRIFQGYDAGCVVSRCRLR